MLIGTEFVKAEDKYRREKLRHSYPKTEKLDQQSHTVIAGKKRKRLRATESWAV